MLNGGLQRVVEVSDVLRRAVVGEPLRLRVQRLCAGREQQRDEDCDESTSTHRHVAKTQEIPLPCGNGPAPHARACAYSSAMWSKASLSDSNRRPLPYPSKLRPS